MVTRNAHANWQGNLKQGQGNMEVGSGSCASPYSATSRFEQGQGTNPEEMVGAAHAGCYSMALAMLLSNAGHEPKMVDTKAAVDLEQEGGGYKISTITLNTEAEVPGIDQSEFEKIAAQARDDCVISKALTGVNINLNANLKS
jgi:osmotically inducible protein OsmC